MLDIGKAFDWFKIRIKKERDNSIKCLRIFCTIMKPVLYYYAIILTKLRIKLPLLCELLNIRFIVRNIVLFIHKQERESNISHSFNSMW